MIGVVFSTGMGHGQLEVSPDLNHSSGRVLASCITRCCMVLLLLWKMCS